MTSFDFGSDRDPQKQVSVDDLPPEWRHAVPGYDEPPPPDDGHDPWADDPPRDEDAPPEDDPPDTDELDEADRIARVRRMFPRLDWHELWSDDTDEEWIHYPLLPARRSVVIYSPPKVGKSLLVLELAVTVSRGYAFLGHRMERRYRVLYVDFENDPRGDIRSRLQAMGYGPDDLDHLDYLSFPSMSGLDTMQGALELLEAVHAYGSEIVIIDTVSRAVVGEENSNDTWRGLYRHTGLRLKQAGVAMLRLDHTGKDESRGQRGGSAKAGDPDAIWRLVKLADTEFRLECTDARLKFDTKSLRVTRHTSPKLHHSVDAASVMTERDFKMAELRKLADDNGLPANTGREKLREFGKLRGIRLSTAAIGEVAKARKASSDLSPSCGDSDPRGDSENLSPSRGDGIRNQPETLPLTSGNTCPHPVGTGGDRQSRLVPVPVPTTIGGDRGTARSGQPPTSCAECGKPMDPDMVTAEGWTTHPGCEPTAAPTPLHLPLATQPATKETS